MIKSKGALTDNQRLSVSALSEGERPRKWSIIDHLHRGNERTVTHAMAIYHCHISNVSRAKGSSSCATYAYISGEKVYDERTQQTFSYARKERILETGIILPVSAPAEYKEPAVMYNSIEQNLTADNARTAKKIELALPKELTLEEQKQIIEDYIRNNLTSEGYAATYAIHGDEKKTGNTHVHVEVPNRPINEHGEWGGKSKKDYALDEDGNRIPVLEYQKDKNGKYLKDGDGNKIPVLDENGQPKQKLDSRNRKQWKRIDVEVNPIDTKDFLFHLRKEWAVECNKHLAPEQQIDHRSNADRGIKNTPMIHEGYAARAIEARGEVSERCQRNREIRAENEQRRQIKEELAATIAEDKALAEKERELHERLRNVGRRIDDSQTGRTPAGERQAQVTANSDRTSPANNTTAGTRDYTAELLAHRRAETEREIARISKERENAARAEREATERKLAAERKAAELRRQREAESRKHQPTPETQKRERPSQQPTKSTEQSHGYTFTR